MYGLIKTHKPNNPVRPNISSIGSATYKLSKYLVNLLNFLLGTVSNSNIKNNVDLISRLNQTNNISNHKMVSFDVTALFTNVPVDDLLNFLKEKLSTVSLPHSTDTILELIKLCVKDCKFVFDGKYYLQKFGFAMGNQSSFPPIE